MSMTDLSSLIEKIEAAEEGSYALTKELLDTIDPNLRASGWMKQTESIDAIVGLIEKELPGWGRASYSGPGQSWGQLYPPDSSFDSHKSVIERANAEALALCAAFLKCLQGGRL